MATPIENWSKSEIRAVVRFLHAKGKNPTEIHSELTSVYGKDVMSKTGVYQCQTLDKLREALRRKRPGRLSKGVILQHDNATPHTAKRTQDWLKRYNWETLPHPPHSPDLAPSDFHLFGPLKRHLAGQRFEDDDDLIEEVTSWLRSLDEKFLRDGIYSRVQRWKKCLDLHGDYVEK